MTVINLTEYNTRRNGVTFENFASIKRQKFEDISNHENNVFCANFLEIFLSKSKICEMTLMSGAFHKSVFDGKTILIKISEEKDKHRYVFIGGDLTCSFLTNDNIYR